VTNLSGAKEALKMDDARDLLRQTMQQVGDAAREALEQITRDVVAQMLEATAGLAQELAENTKKSAPHAVAAARALTDQAAQAAAAAAHQLAETAKDVRDEIPAPILGTVAEEIKEAGVQAQEAATDAMDEGLPLQTESTPRRRGGFLRFLLLGLLVGGLVAFFNRGGDDEDEDFGEENWIEVKHDETGPAMPGTTPAPAEAAAEPAAAPEKPEMESE
jgi:hypothetical protein